LARSRDMGLSSEMAMSALLLASGIATFVVMVIVMWFSFV
jgi:hypothetical protein